MLNHGADLELYDDPAAFLDAAGEHLAADPVHGSVIASVTGRVRDEDAAGIQRDPSIPCWWVIARGDDGAIAGIGMRTAPFEPYPMFVLDFPQWAADRLVAVLQERGEVLGGVNGALSGAGTLADTYAAATGAATQVAMHTRMFEVTELVTPRPAGGRLRSATHDDLDLCVEWVDRFGVEADEQAGRAAGHSEVEGRDVVERKLRNGVLWLWEDEAGTPVHLTGANLPSFGVTRIGPVFTPKEHRGRGYASNAVHQVSQQYLDQGIRVCLFTDQANPTSNGVYEALGYEAVVDMVNLAITRPVPG
jgi:predicted GNAT family acetyltransferase